MSCFFSTLHEPSVVCTDPVLVVNFPKAPTPCIGPNSVVLANGAVVDLFVLGQIVSQFCPDVFGGPPVAETPTQQQCCR